MKISLKSTDKIVRHAGVECRLWQGTTESGIPVCAFIPRLAVSATAKQDEFHRELRETSHAPLAIDWRLLS